MLRRDAWSRYPLLYQKAIWADTWVLPLQANAAFWYNATIEAILNGLNDDLAVLILDMYSIPIRFRNFISRKERKEAQSSTETNPFAIKKTKEYATFINRTMQ